MAVVCGSLKVNLNCIYCFVLLINITVHTLLAFETRCHTYCEAFGKITAFPIKLTVTPK